MTGMVAPLPKIRFTDNNGDPATGAKLFTYQAGTTTKQNTYTDSGLGTANANPIVLDSRGEANCWLDPALVYKFTLSPSTDTDPPTGAWWTVDNIQIHDNGFGIDIRRYSSNLATALSSIGSTQTKLVIASAVTMAADATIPSTLTVEIQPGGSITTTGWTLTINGHFEAGLYQVFSGTGSVVFGNDSVEKIGACWFGAKFDNSTDSGTAFNKTLLTANNSACKHVQMPAGIMRSSIALTFYNGTTDYAGVTLEGVGSCVANGDATPSTVIKFTAALTHGINLIRTESVNRSGRNRLANFEVDGNSLVDNGINVASANDLDNLSVTGCLVNGVRLGDYTNRVQIRGLNAGGNTGHGVGVYGANSTVYSIERSYLGSNTGNGFYAEGGQIAIVRNVVIESNGLAGIRLHALTGASFGGLTFEDFHLEANSTTDVNGFEVDIEAVDNSTTNVPRNITFRHGVLSVTGTATKNYFDLSKARDITIEHVGLAGSTEAITDSVLLTSNSTNIIHIMEDETYNSSLATALANGVGCVEIIRANNAGTGQTLTGGLSIDNLTVRTRQTVGRTYYKPGATTASIAGVATTIWTLPDASTFGVLDVISTKDGGGVIRYDLVVCVSGIAVSVANATVQGSPDAPTFSATGTAVKVLYAANTYSALVTAHEQF